ncbi:rod shape-determining protein MreD [Thalassorhabdus alkalitolerans]|uniref:Rod shape-determining protein MreD n=1 Tax=Thalassorhabdus alkalitolerans TaxID=2282697 RepID=A0ABW0YQ59_9BACI|nr:MULTISPECIES: rod shape-determining protein MreD [Bacillaceae]
MNRYILPALLVFLFLIESTWFQIFFPPSLTEEAIFVPRFVLIVIVLISIFRGPLIGVLYGVGAGVFYDFVFTDLIGIYMFGLGLVAYICAFSYTSVKRSLPLLTGVLLLAVIIFEILTYGLHSVIGLTAMEWAVFLNTRLLPSLLLNGVIGILMLFPLQAFFEKMEKQEELRQR